MRQVEVKLVPSFPRKIVNHGRSGQTIRFNSMLLFNVHVIRAAVVDMKFTCRELWESILGQITDS